MMTGEKLLTLTRFSLQISGVFAAMFIMVGCAAPFGTRTYSGAETVVMKVDSRINGMRRTGLVHIPEGYSPEMSYPLVVVLHGAFSTAEKMELETGFSTLADRHGFVVLYPNGMGIFGLLQHWNAGHCCGKAADDKLDDVAFIEECIEKTSEVLPIDRRRIYITGFSNGGMMAYRYAAEKSGTIAALAAVGASVGGRVRQDDDFWLPPLPLMPVPTIIIHGLSDTAVPAQGGVSLEKGGTREYLSLQQSTEFWLKANDCEDDGLEEIGIGGVEVRKWQTCLDNSAVEQYSIPGWPHKWPGRYFTLQSGNLEAFDATELVWKFFQRFSRKMP